MSMFPIIGTNLWYLQLYSVFLKDFLQALQILKQCFKPRYSTTDHWIQESIKRIINSGLFWAVGAEKKTPKCHKHATFMGVFLMFSRSKNNFNF